MSIYPMLIEGAWYRTRNGSAVRLITFNMDFLNKDNRMVAAVSNKNMTYSVNRNGQYDFNELPHPLDLIVEIDDYRGEQ